MQTDQSRWCKFLIGPACTCRPSGRIRYTKECGNLRPGLSLRSLRAHCYDFFLIKLRLIMGYSLLQSTLCYFIVHVILGCTGRQMLRPDTWRIIATVHDALFASGNTLIKLICKSMRKLCVWFSVVGYRNIKKPVPGRRGAAFPFPAVAIRSLSRRLIHESHEGFSGVYPLIKSLAFHSTKSSPFIGVASSNAKLCPALKAINKYRRKITETFFRTEYATFEFIRGDVRRYFTGFAGEVFNATIGAYVDSLLKQMIDVSRGRVLEHRGPTYATYYIIKAGFWPAFSQDSTKIFTNSFNADPLIWGIYQRNRVQGIKPIQIVGPDDSITRYYFFAEAQMTFNMMMSRMFSSGAKLMEIKLPPFNPLMV